MEKKCHETTFSQYEISIHVREMSYNTVSTLLLRTILQTISYQTCLYSISLIIHLNIAALLIHWIRSLFFFQSFILENSERIILSVSSDHYVTSFRKTTKIAAWLCKLLFIDYWFEFLYQSDRCKFLTLQCCYPRLWHVWISLLLIYSQLM